MSTMAFDTHAMVKQLQQRGFAEPQAEAIIEVMGDLRQESLQTSATKSDLRELEVRLDSRFSATKSDLRDLESRLDSRFSGTQSDLRELELRLDSRFKDIQLRLGSMIMALGGVLIAVKFFG